MTLNSKSEAFSAKKLARIGGIIYLIIIVSGLFGEIFVRNKIIVEGDPAATALNIMASPMLWRFGIAGDLLMQVCDVPLIVIFYILLRPVNKNLALLNLSFNLIQTAVLVVNKLNLLMPMFLLEDAEYLKTVDLAELQTLSYLFIKLHNYGFGVGLIFFGFVCIVEGHLIVKSTFFPRAIGRLMQLAGICYLVNSFILVLYPALSSMIILLPCFVAELALALWMVVKGVDEIRWKQQVAAI
jgi:hypothetical protein